MDQAPCTGASLDAMADGETSNLGELRTAGRCETGQCARGRTRSNFIMRPSFIVITSWRPIIAVCCRCATRRSVSQLCTGHHHIDIAAAALRASQPLAPLRHRRRGTVAFGHSSGVGLDLMTAVLSPHDEAHTCRGGVAERHRRTGVALHRRGRRLAVDWRGPLNSSLLPSFCV